MGKSDPFAPEAPSEPVLTAVPLWPYEHYLAAKALSWTCRRKGGSLAELADMLGAMGFVPPAMALKAAERFAERVAAQPPNPEPVEPSAPEPAPAMAQEEPSPLAEPASEPACGSWVTHLKGPNRRVRTDGGTRCRACDGVGSRRRRERRAESKAREALSASESAVEPVAALPPHPEPVEPPAAKPAATKPPKCGDPTTHLTGPNLRVRPDGREVCRACERVLDGERRARRKAEQGAS